MILLKWNYLRILSCFERLLSMYGFDSYLKASMAIVYFKAHRIHNLMYEKHYQIIHNLNKIVVYVAGDDNYL